jgi:uncharacterized protein YbaR (Trm112 family)
VSEGLYFGAGIVALLLIAYACGVIRRARYGDVACPICKHSLWYHSENGWDCAATVDDRERDRDGYIKPPRRCKCDWSFLKVHLNATETAQETRI